MGTTCAEHRFGSKERGEKWCRIFQAFSASVSKRPQFKACHADVHMNGEYYGAPRDAGAYGDSPSSSSQGYGSVSSDYSPQSFFESYHGDSSYPNFLKTYGHSKNDAEYAPDLPKSGTQILSLKESSLTSLNQQIQSYF